MSKPVFLLFSNRTCGHCNSFRPIWEKMATDNEITSRFELRNIEADWNNEKYFPIPFKWVEAVPMLMIVDHDIFYQAFKPLRNGVTGRPEFTSEIHGTTYSGIRNYDQIKKWLLKQ